jgi:hypothetical protein
MVRLRKKQSGWRWGENEWDGGIKYPNTPFPMISIAFSCPWAALRVNKARKRSCNATEPGVFSREASSASRVSCARNTLGAIACRNKSGQIMRRSGRAEAKIGPRKLTKSNSLSHVQLFHWYSKLTLFMNHNDSWLRRREPLSYFNFYQKIGYCTIPMYGRNTPELVPTKTSLAVPAYEHGDDPPQECGEETPSIRQLASCRY